MTQRNWTAITSWIFMLIEKFNHHLKHHSRNEMFIEATQYKCIFFDCQYARSTTNSKLI